jgi:hypothetical protein
MLVCLVAIQMYDFFGRVKLLLKRLFLVHSDVQQDLALFGSDLESF